MHEESWEGLLRRSGVAEPDECVALLKLALELEYRAHDLYQSLAEWADSPESRQLLVVELAQEEKRHAVRLLHRIGGCAATSQ